MTTNKPLCHLIGVNSWSDLVIVVPHQKPAFTANAALEPAIEGDGDSLIAGDHDARASMSFADAVSYTGHQQCQVARLVAEILARLADLAEVEEGDIIADLEASL